MYFAGLQSKTSMVYSYSPIPTRIKPASLLTFGRQSGTVDFARLVQTLHDEGVFKARYPSRKKESEFEYPKFPGDLSYDNGPRMLQRLERDLPQDVISAVRRSFLDALKQYMPEQALRQWMHDYFKGDYLHSQELAFIRAHQRIPGPSSMPQRVPESLSFNFNAPERKRRDRQLFTNQELAAARQVYQKHPAIPLAVLAFQTSMVVYLDRLRQALDQNQTIPNREKVQARTAIENLRSPMEADNFINNILPAVCIGYYKNHKKDLQAVPTVQDFIDGMNFAVDSGMFHNTVRPPAEIRYADPENPYDPDLDRIVPVADQRPRRFICPAAGLITHLSTTNLADAETGRHDFRDTMGLALAHIHQDLLRRNRPEELAEMAAPLMDS